jgi:site-specific DNA-methyltransferase (adenine-specific)
MAGCGRKIGPSEIICAEFVAWAKEEGARIECGKAERYHAVLCDPPYSLSFMSKEWDSHADYQDWTRQWAAALIPLLYPGALVFCFGGTRTWHCLACGFEDAGFHIWDTLMWLHGQGFPKAQDISKLIDKLCGETRKSKIIQTKTGNTKRRGEGDQDSTYGDSHGGWRDVSTPVCNLSMPWSGHKTAALKPAWEPILCFKAPTQGKVYAELAMEYGSGALNVDGGRINYQSESDKAGATPQGACTSLSGRLAGKAQGGGVRSEFERPKQLGRYPANLALECICDTVEEVDAPDGVAVRHRSGGNTFGGDKAKPPLEDMYKGGKAIRHTDPDCPCFQLDAQAGPQKSGGTSSRRFSDKTRNTYNWGFKGQENPDGIGPSAGNVSRFFYCAKASRSEREAGLKEFCIDDGRLKNDKYGDGLNSATKVRTLEQAKKGVDRGHIANDHPTVKPLALCRWLGTLLLPPESIKPCRLLVPFAGTGSEMIGALEAGWDEVVGIEQDAHYCEIAGARTANAQAQPHLFEPKAEQLDLK